MSSILCTVSNNNLMNYVMRYAYVYILPISTFEKKKLVLLLYLPSTLHTIKFSLTYILLTNETSVCVSFVSISLYIMENLRLPTAAYPLVAYINSFIIFENLLKTIYR